jgi:hypothetical protein
MLNDSDRLIGLPLRALRGHASLSTARPMSARFGGQHNNAVSGAVVAGEFANGTHPSTRGIRSGAWRH